MGFLLRRALRSGVRKGVVGGSRAWLVVAGVATAVRVLRRVTRDEPEVVFHEELPVGGTLVISHGTGRDPEIRRA